MTDTTSTKSGLTREQIEQRRDTFHELSMEGSENRRRDDALCDMALAHVRHLSQLAEKDAVIERLRGALLAIMAMKTSKDHVDQIAHRALTTNTNSQEKKVAEHIKHANQCVDPACDECNSRERP